MFAPLLVPLDGSPMAEAILPAAVSLVHPLGAPVTLLNVIEANAPQTVHINTVLCLIRNNIRLNFPLARHKDSC